jgi:hypothetical protein
MCVLVTVGTMAACTAQPEAPPEQETKMDMPAASMDRPAVSVGMVAKPTTDEEKLANAMAAAPEAVSANATIIELGANGQPRTLRQGTNGWTCLPDFPDSPGVDPMCLDANSMEWVQAWSEKRPPAGDKMGLAYMLVGGSDASNEDPFATEPAAGHQWVDTGPHVMIFNIGDRFAGYPTTHENTKAPYVMWPNTPYAHLMVPVQ